MKDHMYVTMSVLATPVSDPIEKMVPSSYADKTFMDMALYMAQPTDGINAPLSPLEKEVGDIVRTWVKECDLNSTIFIDVLKEGTSAKTYKMMDPVSSAREYFTTYKERAIDGSEVEYDRLDMRVRRLLTGG